MRKILVPVITVVLAAVILLGLYNCSGSSGQ